MECYFLVSKGFFCLKNSLIFSVQLHPALELMPCIHITEQLFCVMHSGKLIWAIFPMDLCICHLWVKDELTELK